MNASRKTVGMMVAMIAALALAGGTAQAVILVTQNFDTAASAAADGWTVQNGTTGGNNFGFSNTSNAGGVPGEAGGAFQRPGNVGFYSDLTGIGLDVFEPMEVSGLLRLAKATSPPTDNFVVFGYWDQNKTATSPLDVNSPAHASTWVGLSYRASDGLLRANVFEGDYGGYNGSGGNAGLAKEAFMPDGNYTFAFTVNNAGFTPGPGEFNYAQITLTLSNTTTAAVTTLYNALNPLQNRTPSASPPRVLNAFGFLHANSTSDANNPLSIFADDLIYTVPEPTAVALLGLSGLLWWGRRER
jgi:hypothetical protein